MNMPHDQAAEQAVLGAILIEPECLPVVIDILPASDMFYSSRHGQIYAAMFTLFTSDEPIDVVSVAGKIGGKTAEVTKVLFEIANATPTAANVAHYAKIVRDKAISRRLIKACHEGVTLATDESQEIDARVAAVEEAVRKASDGLFAGKNLTMRELAHRCMDNYDAKPQPAVKTGFVDFDNLVGGFRPGELVVVAGRTSIGKTTYALDVARQAAAQGVVVQIFSLEMSAERLFTRLVCAQGRIPGYHYRQGYADRTQVLNATAEVYKLPIAVYDHRVTTAEIYAKSLSIRGLGLVVVDFITLIKDKRDGRMSTADHVGEIAKRLQEIAKKLNVPVMVLSQMNRNVEARQTKSPQLSDLRDSGNIEEAADMVIFVHREGYYDRDKPKDDKAAVIVAKNRDGPTGQVDLTYFDYVPTFKNLAKGGLEE